MNYYKLNEITALRDFMHASLMVSGSARHLLQRGIISKVYVGSDGSRLLDDEDLEAMRVYYTENMKSYRPKFEILKPAEVMPVCVLEDVEQHNAFFNNRSPDKIPYFTQNVFKREEYDKMKVCAIDMEFSESGSVTEFGIVDVKTGKTVLVRLRDELRKTHPKKLTIKNAIECIVYTTEQLFEEVARYVEDYDTIVVHGTGSDYKALDDAGFGHWMREKIVVDTSIIYDGINTYALKILIKLIDLEFSEYHAFHNAGNDAWYVSEVFKKLVRFK